MIYGYNKEDFDVASVGNDGASVNNYHGLEHFVHHGLEPFADLEPYVEEADEGDQLEDGEEDEEDLRPRRGWKTLLVEDDEGDQQLVDVEEDGEDLLLLLRRGWKTVLVVALLVLGFVFFVQFPFLF